MIISDSLPIKFWLTAEESFNQKDICGAFSDCYCEHVNYDEYLTLQFQHDAALTLKVYDFSNDTELGSSSITSLEGDYYQIVFIPNDLVDDVNIKKVYFKVFDGSSTELAYTDCVVIGGCVTYPLTRRIRWTKANPGGNITGAIFRLIITLDAVEVVNTTTNNTNGEFNAVDGSEVNTDVTHVSGGTPDVSTIKKDTITVDSGVPPLSHTFIVDSNSLLEISTNSN